MGNKGSFLEPLAQNDTKKPVHKKEGLMDALIPTNKKKSSSFDNVVSKISETANQKKINSEITLPPVGDKPIHEEIKKEVILLDKRKKIGIPIADPIRPKETIEKQTKKGDIKQDELSQMLLHLHLEAKEGKPPMKKTETNEKSVNVTIQLDLNQHKKKNSIVEDIKGEKQIQALRLLSKELSQLETKQTHFSDSPMKGKEEVKQLLTSLQFQVNQSSKGEGEASSTNREWATKLVDPTKMQTTQNENKGEIKIKKEINKEELKIDTSLHELKSETTFKNDGIKSQVSKDFRTIMTKEIEQYIDMKVVGSKKIILQINQEEIGKVEIQIEKKDDKIHILLRIDEKASQEKIENMMENLKNGLKEKQIDVEYELEKENEQHQEKRKEQEEQTKKENKREHSHNEEKSIVDFERLMEVEY